MESRRGEVLHKREALPSLKGPVAYMDFETIRPAIPVWDGMRPYDHAVVQVSVHREGKGGDLVHHEWLPESGEDPREAVRRPLQPCPPQTQPIQMGITRNMKTHS